MKKWLLSYYNPYFCSMNTQLHQLPKSLKYSLVVFLITLSFGYLSGVDLVKHTTDFKAQGIEQNILGDELDETAEELYFKMSEKQLHNIIHSHVISLSMLFLLLSLLLFFTHYPAGLKSFLMIEMGGRRTCFRARLAISLSIALKATLLVFLYVPHPLK